MDVTNGVTCTLRAEAHHPPVVLSDSAVFENHSQDTRYTGPVDTAPTVAATYGTGGNNQPFVIREEKARIFGICSKDSNAMKSANPHSGFYEAATTRTLDGNGGNPTCNQGGVAIVESYGIQGSMIGRADKNGPQGDGINENVSFTLNTVDRHAVAAPTYCASKASFFTQAEKDLANTLVATDYKDPPLINAPTEYTVRRLTPTECARLQGFPDWWCSDLGTIDPTDEEVTFWTEVWETHRRIVSPGTSSRSRNQILKWIKDPHSDAAEYKMWGNGVALPCVFFVLAGIAFYSDFEEKKVIE
jgi:DNA (cytosine-5)-methyltransferase 1